MNVEKTIEFLLEHQARAEVRMDRFDKRFDGITKLMRMGMKTMMATGKKVDALVAAQKRTDLAMAGLIESQKRTDLAMAGLVGSQKRTDLAMAGLVESQKRTDLAMAATDERINSLAAAQKRTEQAMAATDVRLKALIESQQRTDKKFDRFMEAFLKKGSNGRHN